ncbi:oxidoreductase [Aspergillus steynii IBT 23096]|uniref:Oxidoreductase n=1 Tax=Aspergillus steynii IBT 23096 TaxID=1392250 RepID=A0A2I2FSK9_9EURO|nr:oxidoreductase [Aspergillus steynii IBT 23096]PLB43620.1 oxidoreductase [Aspergillus steynii IBT 23096]
MPAIKAILITGCSAHGIGSALALALAQRGHHVFATARNPSKIPISLASLPNVTPLQLDVTSTTSASEAAKAVEDHGAGLDILVNNAGSGYTMPLLDADLETAQQVYETNVWGAVRTVQAFAGLLIEKRGRVVNVCRADAVMNAPWAGIYNSSKSALATLSATLRLELAPLGVAVDTLMVGVVLTSFHGNEPEFNLPVSSRYSAIKDIIARRAAGMTGPKGCSIGTFAESIVDDVLGIEHSKGVVLWRGPGCLVVRFASAFVPRWMSDRLVCHGHGLDVLVRRIKR